MAWLIRPGSLRDSALKMVSISAGETPRGERVDERIVGRQTAGLTEERGLVPHQRDHFLEMRREYFEIIGLARLDPEDLGSRRSLGETGDQRRRRRDGVVALAAHLAQVRERPVLELGGARLGPFQEPR